MTKHTILIGLFAVLFLSGISHFWILNEDYLHPGSELIGHVGIWNNEDTKLRRVTLNFEIIGSDFYEQLGKFDVLSRDNYGRYFFIDLPQDLQPGDYIVKVSACSKKCNSLDDVQYNFITVH